MQPKALNIFLLFVMGFFCQPVSCDETASMEPVEPPRLSVDEVYLAGDRYHGLLVQVKGRLTIGIENDKLHGDEYSLWLDFFQKPYTEESVKFDYTKLMEYKAKFGGQPVVVTGYYDQGITGHFGMSDGGMRDIINIELHIE